MLAQRAGEGATMRKTDESRELTLQKNIQRAHSADATVCRGGHVDGPGLQATRGLRSRGRPLRAFACGGPFPRGGGGVRPHQRGHAHPEARPDQGRGVEDCQPPSRQRHGRIGKNRRKQESAILRADEAGKRACEVHAALHEAAREKIIDSLSSYSDAEISLFNSILHDISSAVEKSSSDIRNNFRKHLDKRGVHPG